MKKRIGIFTRPVDQGTSGSGHHLKEMILHFLRINDKFDVTFIHYAKGTDEIYHLAPDLIIPRNPLAAARAINKRGFDLLHFTPLTIFAPIHFLKAGTVKIATMHGVEPLLCPQYYSRATVLHEKIILPPYSRRMDHVLTVSNKSRDFYGDHWGVEKDKITICYNGLSPAYRVKEPSEYAVTLKKYAADKPYLYHVSKYSERKNPRTLLQAFALLYREEENLDLVISGKGWENEETRGYLKEQGIADRVIFTGFTPEEEVVNLMNGAELFLFPSHAEGFGMPNVEAMACGTPVITSPVFAIPEIVGDAAHILRDQNDHEELAQAVINLLHDESRRIDLRRAGFEQIKPYDWEESARIMYGVYESLLS